MQGRDGNEVGNKGVHGFISFFEDHERIIIQTQQAGW